MADHGRREIKPGAMSKAALDSNQMDLTGFRMGKQRLVSKKKKKSSLKKVILEERSERQVPGLAEVGGDAQQAAARRPVAVSSALSLDAPEFVPSAWALAAAAAQAPSAGAPVAEAQGPAAAIEQDASAAAPLPSALPAVSFSGVQLAAEAPEASGAACAPAESQEAAAGAHGAAATADAAAGADPVGLDAGKPAAADAESAKVPKGRWRRNRADGEAPAQVPLFVPSWLQGQVDEPEATDLQERSRVDFEVDGELPVAEAFEQMKALQEEGRRGAEQRPKPQQQPRGADLEVRQYVHQVLSDELDEKVKLMLSELVRFQERAKERDPLKYAKQKRFCVGIRESKRAIARNKAKCIILAPNLEVSTAEGGLDDTVEDLMEAAREAEVPVVFALSRNRIGKALGKNIRLSIVSVLSAEGAHQQLKEVLKLTDDLRRQWVLRQMSQVTSEDAEEARRRAEEKVQRDAERKAAREQREAERKAEEERKRIEAKAAKEAEKARRAEERKAQIERRRAEKAARMAAEAEEAAQRGEEPSAEGERRLAEEKAEQEEKERARREAEERAERERRRIEAELAAKEAAARAAAAGSDSDSDSDVDLPAGFNDSLF